MPFPHPEASLSPHASAPLNPGWPYQLAWERWYSGISFLRSLTASSGSTTLYRNTSQPNGETKWIERCSTNTTCCSHASPGAKHGSKKPSSASILQQLADTQEWVPPRESLPAACCQLTHPCETIIKFLILNCYILECLSQTTDNQNIHYPLWRTTEVGMKCTAHPSCLDSHPTRMFLLASHVNLVGLGS